MLKKDKEFNQTLNKLIIKKDKSHIDQFKNEKIIDTLNFGDLFYAIHGYTMEVSGKKTDNQWCLSFVFTDTFDFTQIKNPLVENSMSAKIGWTGNDVAVLSQKSGAISPVDNEALFNGVWEGGKFTK